MHIVAQPKSSSAPSHINNLQFLLWESGVTSLLGLKMAMLLRLSFSSSIQECVMLFIAPTHLVDFAEISSVDSVQKNLRLMHRSGLRKQNFVRYS